MKLVIFETKAGIIFKKSPALQWEAEEELLGTIEIEEPKKVVTKEAASFLLGYSFRQGHSSHSFHVPVGAINIKCTYEIEE